MLRAAASCVFVPFEALIVNSAAPPGPSPLHISDLSVNIGVQLQISVCVLSFPESRPTTVFTIRARGCGTTCPKENSRPSQRASLSKCLEWRTHTDWIPLVLVVNHQKI